MGLLFQPGEFKATVTTPTHMQFTEQQLLFLIGEQRLYFDLSGCVVLIVNAYAHGLQERFNMLASKTLYQSQVIDTAVYGPALLVNCDELAPSVKLTMRLEKTRTHE